MEQRKKCVYRKKKCFHICNKTTIKNSFYCCYHIHSKKKHLCKIFFNVLEDRYDLEIGDIYDIYKYILDNTNERNESNESDDIFISILFIDLLKMIPKAKLSNIYRYYLNQYAVTKDSKESKEAKDSLASIYAKIYLLNKRTYDFRNICNINVLINFQNIVKYKLMCISDSLNTHYLNEEELFTTVCVANIHPRKLFIIKDIKASAARATASSHAFDVVELEYFVRKCLADNIAPYNPYTREILSDKVLWKLKMKIIYDNIIVKKEECIWTTDMNAYTDLSIEIERRGFYNNPEWFKKMTKNDFWKCIKLFKDFSRNIEDNIGNASGSGKYFLNINDDDSFTYDFCKESIRLFRECNDDLYVLCCNYMKALALCSNDFYNNIPDWLSSFETTSHLASSASTVSIPSIASSLTYSSFISALITNNNYGVGDDLLNNRNMNMNNVGHEGSVGSGGNSLLNDTNLLNSVVNPSNNFLLYYYVEYM